MSSRPPVPDGVVRRDSRTLTAAAFGQRRKMLRQSLKGVARRARRAGSARHRSARAAPRRCRSRNSSRSRACCNGLKRRDGWTSHGPCPARRIGMKPVGHALQRNDRRRADARPDPAMGGNQQRHRQSGWPGRNGQATSPMPSPPCPARSSWSIPPRSPPSRRTAANSTSSMAATWSCSVRPEAERRFLLTGHMDTVFPADHPFQSVTWSTTRPSTAPAPPT